MPVRHRLLAAAIAFLLAAGTVAATAHPSPEAALARAALAPVEATTTTTAALADAELALPPVAPLDLGDTVPAPEAPAATDPEQHTAEPVDAAATGPAATAAVEPAAATQGYAPINRPGPALRVPRKLLDASLTCPANLSTVNRPVVLMIPGTTVTPQEAFSWNYGVALKAEGIPYCMVEVPQHTNGDIQVAAEYVVDAVRTIHRATGHKVILFGWSQGASTLPRWALRWWPDIRPKVSSLVGLAPLNNIGTAVATGLCVASTCIPAGWQQAIGSKFMAALNSGQQTFPGIAYTVIYSRLDEVVTPNVDGSLSKLPPGLNVANFAIQDLCALDVSEHITIPASPTAWALALDAFKHPGQPASLSRAQMPTLCLPGTMPHVDPVQFVTQTAAIVANVGPRVLAGQVAAEPPLACYVTASC